MSLAEPACDCDLGRGSGERSSCTRTWARFWVMATWIEEVKTAAVTPILAFQWKTEGTGLCVAVQLSRLWGPSPFRGASSVLSTSWSQRWEIFVAVCGRGRGEQKFLSTSTLEMPYPWSPYKPLSAYYKHMTGSVATIEWHLGPVRQSLRRHLTHLFLSQELIRFTFWYWMISMYWVI